MQILLGLIHGGDYIVSHFLMDMIIFYSLILIVGGGQAFAVVPNWAKNIQRLVILNFITTFIWMMLSVHDMTESWDVDSLWMGMTHTSFAHIWCYKLILIAALYFVLRFTAVKKIVYILIPLVIVYPFANVLTSHATAAEDFIFLRASLDWVHSLTAAVWTGGLCALFFWLNKKIESKIKLEPQVSYQVVTRFSHFAMASTALIGVSGLVMAWLNGVSLFKPWTTDYGMLVLAKLGFFCLALGAAAVNQFLHLRTWNPENENEFDLALRREVGIELLLVLIVFTFAGFLTRTALPGG